MEYVSQSYWRARFGGWRLGLRVGEESAGLPASDRAELRWEDRLWRAIEPRCTGCNRSCPSNGGAPIKQ
jgi:hypothetical protein